MRYTQLTAVVIILRHFNTQTVHQRRVLNGIPLLINFMRKELPVYCLLCASKSIKEKLKGSLYENDFRMCQQVYKKSGFRNLWR